MKKFFVFFLAAFLCVDTLKAQTKPEVLPADLQIKIAVLSAPEQFRAGATVLGYNKAGEFVELRKGTNDYICLAPNYKTPAFYAAFCYHNSLEPFMRRGRELTAEGKAKERDEIRGKEHAEGKLPMPQQPTTLYCYWGSLETMDRATGEMSDAKRRYVIYVPFAKAADLGLPNVGNNLGMPWLMAEGTYKAHIMITPPLDHKH